MKLILSFSLFLVILNQQSLLIKCAERVKTERVKSSEEPFLDKSLADNLQKALDTLSVDQIPNEFKQPQPRDGDE
jgi:hypothetical protein